MFIREWTARRKLKISLLRALATCEIKQDFFDLRDFKVISLIRLIVYVLLAFSRFLVQIFAKYHSPPQVFVHDFAISSIVSSSLVPSRSNHDGRIMPSNHVQQNPGLHTTLKPAVKEGPNKHWFNSFAMKETIIHLQSAITRRGIYGKFI